MDSSVFKEETSKLRFRSISDADVLSIAERAYKDQNVMELYSGSACTLDDYVRVLAESIPSGEVSNEHIMNFLKAKRLLKDTIKEDKNLINWYCDKIEEARALPILGAEEIAVIIVTAFLTGTFSNIAKKLVDKLFSRKSINKKELRKALDLIFANSILDLLEEHDDGLTTGEIAEITGMREEEVIEFLVKYKSQGWIHKKTHQDREKWKIKEGKAKIIEGYLKLRED